MIQTLRQKSRDLKSWMLALYLAYRDPRVPWYARLFVICVVAYAFSPIDLVPDFVPVLGYLDDLILIPIGIWLAMRMIPRPVLDECRERAQAIIAQEKPTNRVAAAVIVAVWLLLAGLGVMLGVRAFS